MHFAREGSFDEVDSLSIWLLIVVAFVAVLLPERIASAGYLNRKINNSTSVEIRGKLTLINIKGTS